MTLSTGLWKNIHDVEWFCDSVCKGQCKNCNNAEQQRAVRKLMKDTGNEGPIPNRCAGSIGGVMKNHCPY